MKAQVVMPRSEIGISGKAEAVIFIRRPSIYDFLAVMKDAPQIQTFIISESYGKTMSRNIQTLCDIRGVRLVIQNSIQGQKGHMDGKLVDMAIKKDVQK